MPQSMGLQRVRLDLATEQIKQPERENPLFVLTNSGTSIEEMEFLI